MDQRQERLNENLTLVHIVVCFSHGHANGIALSILQSGLTTIVTVKQAFNLILKNQ